MQKLRLVKVSIVSIPEMGSYTSINFIPATNVTDVNLFAGILESIKSYNDIDPTHRCELDPSEVSEVDYEATGIMLMGPNDFGCYGDDGMVSKLLVDANGNYYMDFDIMILREMAKAHVSDSHLAHFMDHSLFYESNQIVIG